MNRKKLVMTAAAAAVLLGLSACTSDETDTASETTTAVETTATSGSSTTEQAEDPQQTIARLKAENDALKSVKITVEPQDKPAVSVVQALTPEQLQAQAEELGFTDPKQVESIGKIAAHVAAPAYHKAALLEQALLVERTVNSAKSVARANDPQFSKLEGYVDEYLSMIGPEDKSDPAKLKTHMERASFYARGKMGAQAGPQGGRQSPPPTASRNDMQDDKHEPAGPETYATVDGKTSITIVKRVKPEIMKMHAHPAIEGAVLIDPKDEWRGPVFEKDVRKT